MTKKYFVPLGLTQRQMYQLETSLENDYIDNMPENKAVITQILKKIKTARVDNN